MRALVILLALSCFAQTFAAKGTLEDIQQFTRGWLVGVFNQDVAAEATECLDLNTLEGHIQNAIEDFKKKTPEGIKDGVIELFEFFVALPKAVDLCLTEHADVIASIKAKTGAIINLINNPDELLKQILKNTVTHGITIFEDIQNGIDAINAKNWYEVGKDFGDAVDLALFGTGSLESTQDDIKNFLRGWLIGVFNNDVAGNVVECLNIASLKDSIDRMIEDFKQKNVQGIVNGIKELFGLFIQLPSAVDSCLSQHQDVAAAMKQKIAIIVGYLNDPVKMAAQVLKNSLSHGFAMFGDITDGIFSIKSGNWQKAGTDFGDALNLALFGNTQLKSLDDVKAFLKGWLIGVFDQDVAGEVVECLDIASLEGHVQKAIEDFEQKTVQGIKDGIIELFDVFKALPGAITSCLSQHTDVAIEMVKKVKTIISYIEDPVQLGKTVLINVLKHGVTIFKDIEQGVSAIKSGNFEEAGKDFGDALDAALFGTLTYSSDLTNAGEFMRGWLIGVFDQDVAAEVTECLNLQDLIVHIDNAINDFKKGTAAGVEEGLVELFDVFIALPNAIDVCLQAHGDVAADMKNHVATIISYIQDPSQLKQIVAKNVLLHGVTIFKDVEDAFAQIKAQNWRQAGVDFGDAVDLSLFGQLGATSQVMNDFLKGFLQGFFHEDVAQELTECVDIASLEQHIANAVNAFKELNLQGFIDGFKELYFVYNSLQSGVQKCIGDHPDLVAQIQKKIQEVQQIIQDPSQLEQLIMNNIKAHGLQIVLDVNDALKNIKAAQWHQAGQDFGEVADLILFGQAKSLQSGEIEDIEAFVKGLLVGVFRDDIVEKATDCMNLESFEQHIQNAYDYFSQFTLQGFEQGFKELLALYEETQKGVVDCLRDYPELLESVLNKIKVITQIINDPKQLEKLIMSNVQLYGTAILADLKDSAWAIQNKQWYQAGHDVGDLVNLLIFGNKLGMSQDQLKQLTKGFLIGVFQEDVAGEVVECLELDEVNQHIQAAIADFKQMTLDGFKNGVLELLKIYQILPDAIDNCMTQHQEVAERMKAKIEQIKSLIANPSEILPTIESNFMAHSFTVVKDILGSFSALKSENYLEAGKDLGETANLLLFNGQLKLKISQVDAKAFVKGWIIGVFQEDVAGEVVECLQIDVVTQHLQAAFADFKSLNIQGFEQGMAEIFIVMKLLPAGIDSCMSQHQDVAQRMKAKVAQIEAVIQDPSQLLSVLKKNLFAHGFAILKDIASAGESIVANNWQQAGTYFGEALNYLLFGGNGELQVQIDAKAFVKGWIIGVFQEDVAGEVVECLQIDVVTQHLQAAFADFKQLNIQGFQQGMAEIFIVMKLLPAGIDSCMSQHQDVAQRMKAKVAQIEAVIQDPSQLLSVLKKNLFAHGFAILKDIASAGESIVANNWQQAGTYFGEALNYLLFGGNGELQFQIDAKAFVKGWIIGVFQEDVAGEVVECLQIDVVTQHLQAAFADFKSLNIQGFEQGMAEIFIVMKLLPAGIDSCMSQHQDVAQRMKAKVAQIEAVIQDPSQLLSVLKKNLFAHGFAILKDIASAGESIVANNWQQAGTYFGEALNYLLFGGNGELQVQIDAKAFVKGWIIGVFQEDVAGEVVECLQIDVVTQHLQAALQDFKQFNLDGFKKGALELLAIFEMLPGAINQCMSQHEAVAQQMKAKIATIQQYIQDPSQVLPVVESNFKAHAFAIIKDVAGAAASFISGNSQQAGQYLGEATNYLIFGGQFNLKISQDDVKAFVKGWIIGVFQEDVAGEVVECLQIDVVYQHLQAALQDFKQLNLDGFKKGALELLEIFKLLPGAINQCMSQHEAVAQQMKAKIATIQQYIQDPSQVLPVVASNFKAHAFAIIKDAAGAASSFISGNYQQAGQYLGETTNYLIFGGSLKAKSDEIKAFIQGWIIGVFKEDVAGEVVECLDIEVVYEHLQAALADFQKLNIEGLEQGALEIYVVMKLLPAGIDQCLTEHQDVAQKMKAKIESIIHYFEDPNQLLAILKTNFKANIFTIIKDLADAGQAITSSNWKLAGQDFGDVTSLLLFGGQLFETADDVKAFVKGWIIGVFQEDVAGEVVECLNLEIINQYLQAAFEDFKKFSIQGFEQGMAEIYIVMKLLPAGIDSCMSQHQDVAQRMKAKVAQIEAVIQDPSQLLSLLKKNIFAHGFTILKDIASAGESIVAKNWQQAGTYLGEALNYLLFGGNGELEMLDINIKAFIKGWLVGVFKQDVAGEVVNCLDVQNVFNHLQAAMTDFKQHSIEGFKAGALEILTIFGILPPAVDSCLSQHQDVASQIKSHISQFVQIAQDPIELVNLLKQNVLAHGFDILDDLAHATSAIIEKRWRRAGKALGDCTNLLIFGGSRSVVQNLLQKGGISA